MAIYKTVQRLKPISGNARNIEIYGYKAKVFWDGKMFIGRIDKLHVTDAASSIIELEKMLKSAVSGLLELQLSKSYSK